MFIIHTFLILSTASAYFYDTFAHRSNQKQEIISTQASLARLQEEERRIILNIEQATEELINTTTLSEKDTLDTIATNQQRIAEIDTRLNRNIVENQKRIQEIESEISSVEQTLKYQIIPAPVSGTIFDLGAYSGYVPSRTSCSTSTENRSRR